MLIKIKDIPDAGLSVREPLGRALVQDALDGMSADLERSHADARLDVTKTEGDVVIVRGAVAGEVAVPCVRCLREVLLPVEAPIRMIFTPDEVAEGDDSVEDDTEHATHDGHAVALDEVLREALILAVPMAPLCRPACKGLCPVCGGDKNERDCGCTVEKLEDPRLAPLKGLIQKV